MYGVLLVAALSILLIIIAITMYEVTITIESIPSIVQIEMKKTRDTFREENKQTRIQNSSSKTDLLLELKNLEKEKDKTKAQLDALEKDVQKNSTSIQKNKTEVAVTKKQEPLPIIEDAPKRKKFLGIF